MLITIESLDVNNPSKMAVLESKETLAIFEGPMSAFAIGSFIKELTQEKELPIMEIFTKHYFKGY